MSRQINQPSNQIKLTNVSLVRLKKGKKRFEIACYKNKVLEWRQGIERDPDNVLQIPSTVFLNVSKGQTAPRDDLDRAFGKARPVAEIVLEILNTGEIQVGERERAAQMDRVRNEVVAIVASKLVDPRTWRVYTPGMIEKALDLLSGQAHARNEAQQQQEKKNVGGEHEDNEDKEEEGQDDEAARKKALHVWTGVVTTKSAKSQALEAMKALIAHQLIPVARARMRLRVTCPLGILKQSVKPSASANSSSNSSSSNAPNTAVAAASSSSSAGGGGKGKKGKGGKGKHAVEKPASEPAAAAALPKAAEDSGDDDEDDATAGHKAPGTVKDRILSYVEQVESQEVVGSEWEVVGFVEPGAYKALADFVGNDTKGQGRVEVIDMAITHED